MPHNCKDHAADEQLERYSLRSLAEPDLAELEEHLLVCTHCQERLQEIDAYTSAMRGAAAKLEQTEESRRRFWTRVSSLPTFRKAGWAMSVAALLLAVVAVRVSWQATHSNRPLALSLEASRGSELRHAPAHRPLNLSLDVTGLPAAAYRIEIVDAAGSRLAESRAVATQATVRTRVPDGLRTGTYFIRVYSPARELLREYGLQVD